MAGDTNLPAGVTLVDGFPFDSSPNLVFTDQGYPRGDRSVDAWVMQRVFKQFFSNGVFGTPANALQINKGTSGLTVTIQPGMFIIDGAMGGVKASDGPLTLTLDANAAQGNVCYAIMLRYDNNPNMRGLGFRVVKGTAATTPVPPAPDQASENVYELRLGYVTVSNGATDLTNATVTNEKGLAVCPYAAPFDTIDLSGITHDALVQANEALEALKDETTTSLQNVQQFISKNMELIESALDGTAVGHLQNQIDTLKTTTLNADSLDPDYLALQKDSPDTPELIGLVANAVGTREIKDSAVTAAKIDDSAVNTKIKVDGKTIHKGNDNALYAAPSKDGTFGDYFMFSKEFIDTYLDGIPSNIVLATTLSNIGSIHASKNGYFAMNGKAYLCGASSGRQADIYITSEDGTTEHKTAAISGGMTNGIVVTTPTVSGKNITYVVSSAGGSTITNSYDDTASATLNVVAATVTMTKDGAITTNVVSDSITSSQDHSYSFDSYTGFAAYFYPAVVGDGSVMGGTVLDAGAVSGTALQRCGCIKIASSGAITKKTGTGPRQQYYRHFSGPINAIGYQQGVYCHATMQMENTVNFGFACTADMETMTVYNNQAGPPSGWSAVDNNALRNGTTKRYVDGKIQTRTYNNSGTPSVSEQEIGELAQPLAPSLNVPNGTYHELPGGAFMVKTADGIVLAKDWNRFRVAKNWIGTNVAGIVQNNEVPSAMTSQTVDGVYSEIFSNGTIAAVMFINMKE